MIGIIVPAYNASKFLVDCLESIFNQSYQSFYLVCINDGSTDNTLDILDSYKKSFSNKMTIINQVNKGPSCARNAGLDFLNNRSDIDLVAFIDADDVIDKDYLQTMVELMTEAKADIVSASFGSIDSKSGSLSVPKITKKRLLSSFESVKLIVEDKEIFSMSHCKLFKKSLWNDIRFPIDIVVMEDQATLFKVFYNSNSVLLTDYNGYCYRKNDSSLTSTYLFTNKGVIDSYKGFYEAVKFDYLKYDDAQRKIVMNSAIQSFAFCFLKMYSRFNRKSASQDLLREFKDLERTVKNQKIIQKYLPVSRQNKIRKMIYLHCHPFYRLIFKAYDRKRVRN